MTFFYVGQKVVCVNDKPLAGFAPFGGAEKLIVGAVYTIARILVDSHDIEIVHLEEVHRDQQSIEDWGPDCGYRAVRFRPIVEKKTDISIFTAMLNPSERKVKA